MSGLGWDSADLLDRFLTYAGRGNGGVMAADELWTTTRAYTWLADAQEAVYTDLSPIVPHAFVNAPVLLTTTDGGVTYTYPTGTFPGSFAFGHVEVYGQENAGWTLLASTYNTAGADFVIEATQIRSPGNRPRTFASGPWARGTGFPARLSASVEPALVPDAARELILFRALAALADVSAGGMDASRWEQRYADARNRWVTTWSTQYSAQGGQGSNTITGAWYLAMSAMNGT